MQFTSYATRRGFSLLDALVVLMVLAVALGMGVVYGMFRDPGRGACGKPLTCSTRVNQIHKGLVLFANDFGGGYPVPTDLSPETAAITTQTGNSSASFYSYMTFNTYYSPEVITCPEDASPNLVVKNDYRYGIQGDPDWNTSWLWDPNFSADISKAGCNVSYATLAMIGDRRTTQWRDSLDPNFAVVSDRGPKDGAWNAKSVTMKSHGNTREWVGNVAFNDGHVQRFTFSAKNPNAFTVNGDNLFRVDDLDKGGDMWLGLFGDTDEETTNPFWD